MTYLTGLWQNEIKSGRRAGQNMLSGKLGYAKLLIFRNDKKTPGSKQPDFVAYIAEDQPREQKQPQSENLEQGTMFGDDTF